MSEGKCGGARQPGGELRIERLDARVHEPGELHRRESPLAESSTASLDRCEAEGAISHVRYSTSRLRNPHPPPESDWAAAAGKGMVRSLGRKPAEAAERRYRRARDSHSDGSRRWSQKIRGKASR